MAFAVHPDEAPPQVLWRMPGSDAKLVLSDRVGVQRHNVLRDFVPDDRDYDQCAGYEPARWPKSFTATIYAGQALSSIGGVARPLVAGEKLIGFAHDYAGPGDLSVLVVEAGLARMTVVGVTGPRDYSAVVFAVDDATFSLIPTSTPIGRVAEHRSGRSCVVYFQAAARTRVTQPLPAPII